MIEAWLFSGLCGYCSLLHYFRSISPQSYGRTLAGLALALLLGPLIFLCGFGLQYIQNKADK